MVQKKALSLTGPLYTFFKAYTPAMAADATTFTYLRCFGPLTLNSTTPAALANKV
jgi:hypothetical protein